MVEWDRTRAYCGDMIFQFVIDRLALGISAEVIANEFKALHDITLEVAFIKEKEKEYESKIKERREEFKQIFTSELFFNSLIKIKKDLESVQDQVKADGNMKAYLGVIQALQKNLELYIKSIDMLKDKNESKVILLQQNNYYALELLANDGLIEIKKPLELKKLVDGSYAVKEGKKNE